MAKGKIVIITGANSGLGKAIADIALKDDDAFIISLSRSLNKDHEGISKKKLAFIKTDLSKKFSEKFLSTVNKNLTPESVLYFFSNAGIVLPISKVGEFEKDETATSINVNIHYPVNLVNLLLKKITANKITLVNISSGAGINPVAHWSLYCASKAFMKMFFKVLAEENKENDRLEFYDIDPGVMDTVMQQNIREHVFPRQRHFTSLKQEGNLQQPEQAASKILAQVKYN